MSTKKKAAFTINTHRIKLSGAYMGNYIEIEIKKCKYTINHNNKMTRTGMFNIKKCCVKSSYLAHNIWESFCDKRQTHIVTVRLKPEATVNTF